MCSDIAFAIMISVIAICITWYKCVKAMYCDECEDEEMDW